MDRRQARVDKDRQGRTDSPSMMMPDPRKMGQGVEYPTPPWWSMIVLAKTSPWVRVIFSNWPS